MLQKGGVDGVKEGWIHCFRTTWTSQFWERELTKREFKKFNSSIKKKTQHIKNAGRLKIIKLSHSFISLQFPSSWQLWLKIFFQLIWRKTVKAGEKTNREFFVCTSGRIADVIIKWKKHITHDLTWWNPLALLFCSYRDFSYLHPAIFW